MHERSWNWPSGRTRVWREVRTHKGKAIPKFVSDSEHLKPRAMVYRAVGLERKRSSLPKLGKETHMISPHDALELVLEHARPLEEVLKPLDKALGFCLADGVIAVPADAQRLSAGSPVDFRPWRPL